MSRWREESCGNPAPHYPHVWAAGRRVCPGVIAPEEAKSAPDVVRYVPVVVVIPEWATHALTEFTDDAVTGEPDWFKTIDELCKANGWTREMVIGGNLLLAGMRSSQ